MELFISTFDIDQTRMDWSRQTILNYKQYPLDITIIDAGSPDEQLEWFKEQGLPIIHQPKAVSTFRRFIIGDEYAKDSVYLFTDNDCKPITEDWLDTGLDIFSRHPNFGYIGLRMSHCDWQSDGDHDREVRGVFKCGGVGFLRKGATKYLQVPERIDIDKADDYWLCDSVRKTGQRVGCFEHIYFEHIGRSHSTPGLYDQPNQ